MTNFVLPLLAVQKSETSSDIEHASRVEILQAVVEYLKKTATPENLAATEIVIRNYYSRMKQHLYGGWKTHRSHKHNLLRDILSWEKDIILHLAEMDQIKNTTTEEYIKETKKLMSESGRRRNSLRALLLTVWHSLKWKKPNMQDKDMAELKKINTQIVKDDNGLTDSSQAILDVAVNGFHMEQTLIQEKLEAKLLSWKTAKEMQANITMLEAQLKAE
jgi:hypothetical protein